MQKATEIVSQMQMTVNQPKQKILVVDDSADTLMLHKMLLELENFAVFTAQSGIGALDILKENSKFDLVLLDMNMDEMTGLDFLNQLEIELPEFVSSVPIVFMSGVDNDFKSKAVGFIRKPVEIAKFIDSVKHFIEVKPAPLENH